jgi:hypothetical protein
MFRDADGSSVLLTQLLDIDSLLSCQLPDSLPLGSGHEFAPFHTVHALRLGDSDEAADALAVGLDLEAVRRYQSHVQAGALQVSWLL